MPGGRCQRGQASGDGGCGDAWPWGWHEVVNWAGTLPPATGDYVIWLRYAESDAGSSSGCRHGGLEDVVVLIKKDKTWSQRWMVLDPLVTDWVKVATFTYP